MAEKVVQFAGKFFTAGEAAVADAETVDVDPGDSSTGAIEVHGIAYGGSCDLTLLMDLDEDGAYELEIDIDSLSGEGISQDNQIQLAANDNMLLRITNTSGGEADFVVTGVEVSQ